MALTIQNGPNTGESIVLDNVFFDRPDSPAMAVDYAGDAGPSIEVSKGYPVYNSDILAILEKKLLDAARPTSWQYVVRKNAAFRLAEISNEARFVSSQSQDLTEALLDVIDAAERLDLVQQSDYELRILRVPEVYLNAVWLHAKEQDWLLPVRPAPKPLQAGSILTEAQLVFALTPFATMRLDSQVA